MILYTSLFIIFNFIFSESDLLRSQFLTNEMINNVYDLDKYEKTVRKIFNKYEKAKFYQIVSYTYSQKYESLVAELNLLEKQYMSVMNTYSDDVNFSFIDNMPDAAIKNEFTPILFSENARINVKLFKAKAALFKKQYHEFVEHFNIRLNIFERELSRVKKLHNSPDNPSNYSKIYNGYESFILNSESYSKNKDSFISILDTNNILVEFNWVENNIFFKREFQYFNNSSDIKRTIDYQDEKAIVEVNYDIGSDEFVDYLMNKVNYNDGIPYIDEGNFSVKYFNRLNKPFKIKYFFASGEVFGCIIKNYQEELELIDEIWYIDDCETKVRELKNIYDPKTNKKILFETHFK